jgi:DNA-binding response OmpR family regulator
MAEAARILVVDDEVPVCKSVSNALVTEGYSIDTALSAEEALRRAKESHYEVVITDLMMPGLSGMDLLRTVAETMPDTKVIMITGYPSIKSAVEATKLGAFDYIPKPFTPNELRSLVSRALERKRYDERNEITPPDGIYCIPENSWAAITESGDARIGIHHIFLRTIPHVFSLDMPKEGETRYQGEACARLTDSQGHVHKVWTPVSGRVIKINQEIVRDHSVLMRDPYGEGWLFVLTTTNLEDDLKNLTSVGA